LANAPAFAQKLGTARPVEAPVAQLAAGLILCALAAFAIIALMKKRRTGGAASILSLLRWRTLPRLPANGITVLETRRLSVHADLCRFIAGNREYLVIISSGSTTVLQDEAVSDTIHGERPGGAS
jgi:hypothetical protein